MPARRVLPRLPVVLLALVALGGCSLRSTEEVAEPAPTTSGSASPSASPTASPTVSPTPSAEPTTIAVRPSDGRRVRASLTIPAIGVRDLPVVPYAGTVDDREGELIQNGGDASAPGGPLGGTGPGGIGNYLVSAHRTAATAAFRRLPELRRGDRVRVDAGGVRYVYEITGTTRTSFRQPASKARQRAAVPGRPGVRPTRAMISLITCATPEDHAAGNYWADELGNPEHRIDKVGRLVATRPIG